MVGQAVCPTCRSQNGVRKPASDVFKSPPDTVPKGSGNRLVAISRLFINKMSWWPPRQCFGGTGVGICWSGAVHDGRSEPRLLAYAAGCVFAGTIRVCDAEGSIHADANALRSDEYNHVRPGNAGEDAR